MLWLCEIDTWYTASAPGTLTAGLGLRRFALARDRRVDRGAVLTATAAADASVTMTGTVLAYDARARAVDLDVTAITGAGTFTGWTLAGLVVEAAANRDGYAHSTAPRLFPKGLLDVGLGSVTAFADGRTFGMATVSTGALKVANVGGARDHWRQRGTRGRQVRVWVLPDERAPWSQALRVLTVTGEQIATSGDDLLIGYSDLLGDLGRPVQPATFKGDNAGGLGVEGGPELKDQHKPLWRGYRWNVPVVLVNDVLALYQASARPMHGTGALKVGGEPLAAGAHRTFAQITDAAIKPAVGTYDWHFGPTGSFYRLPTRPLRAVTVDGWEGATAADRLPGAIVRRTLIEDAGYPAAQVAAADAAAVDAAAPFECGWWAGPGGMTILAALNEVAPCAPLWLAPDALGVWRMGRVGEPAGAPAARFVAKTARAVSQAGDAGIVAFEAVPARDPERATPVHEVTVEFLPNGLVQRQPDLGGDASKDAAGDVVGGAAVRAQLAAEVSRVTWPESGPDPALLQAYPVLNRITVRTSVRTTAQARALAQHLHALWSVPRDTMKLSAPLGMASVAAWQLGRTVWVQHPRHGYADGRLLTVYGFDPRAQEGAGELLLWGAPT